ncbi:Hypothetical_protein [Hexamita inflata]|uniref:Hypothetical_protein n=1 Tax=Hexamita inflata TaxID=28002 RepID=A0AA86UZH2_9EUKA|nr:Hypothetical protein HINF_LOCUS58231 [Hexamita inflata]
MCYHNLLFSNQEAKKYSTCLTKKKEFSTRPHPTKQDHNQTPMDIPTVFAGFKKTKATFSIIKLNKSGPISSRNNNKLLIFPSLQTHFGNQSSLVIRSTIPTITTRCMPPTSRFQ